MFTDYPFDSLYRQGQLALITSVFCFALVAGCDSGTAVSIYDPTRSSLPDPVIENITPEGRALAGVDVVTITGSNFSIQPTDNLVYFGTDRGDVLEASANQLRVFVPNVPQPELQLRMSVVGAENFSNSIPYALDAPFIEFGDIKDFEDVFGITTDASGNLYASLFAFGLPVGIIRITPEGERSEYINTSFPWLDLEFGSDNALYAVRNVRALFQFPDGGTNFEVFAVIPDRNTKISSIAVDSNNRIWAAGDNTDIYRIDSDMTITTYSFEADIRDLILFGDVLYVTGIQDQTSKVWRFSIDSNGDLGAVQEIFDLTSFNSATPHALAIATSGHLYIGTDGVNPIIVLDPDQVGEALYPGVLTQPIRWFAWGPEGLLYGATNSTGLNPSGIVQIISRRLGYR